VQDSNSNLLVERVSSQVDDTQNNNDISSLDSRLKTLTMVIFTIPLADKFDKKPGKKVFTNQNHNPQNLVVLSNEHRRRNEQHRRQSIAGHLNLTKLSRGVSITKQHLSSSPHKTYLIQDGIHTFQPKFRCRCEANSENTGIRSTPLHLQPRNQNRTSQVPSGNLEGKGPASRNL
jgi:hypothetical protein